jgi:hypothetical protein
LGIHFTVGAPYESAAPLAEKMSPQAYQTSAVFFAASGVALSQEAPTVK